MSASTSLTNTQMNGGAGFPRKPSAAGGGDQNQSLGERLLERHGGIIFSIAIHLMIASFLLVWPWIVPPDTSKPRDPQKIRVTFAPPDSTPPPIPPVITPPHAPTEEWRMEDAASTGHIADPDNAQENPTSSAEAAPPEDLTDPSDSPEENLETPESSLDAPPERPSETPLDAPTPDIDPGATRQLTEEQLEYIEAQKKLVSEQLQKLDKKADAQSNEVQMLLMTTAARQSFYVSSGAQEGVARTIDLRGVPKGILQRVLKRNGIEILYKYMEAGPANRSPLSGVVTNDTTYTTPKNIPAGNYEVMEVSAAALKNLARLEQEWIEDHHLSPLKIRLEKVTYGIMRVGESGHWGLGILKIEYRDLPK